LRLNEHVVVDLENEIGRRTKRLQPAKRRQRFQSQVL
jgi:hypothetical protein